MNFTVASQLGFVFVALATLRYPNKKQLAFTIAGDPGIEEGVAFYDSSLPKEDALILRGYLMRFEKGTVLKNSSAFANALAISGSEFRFSIFDFRLLPSHFPFSLFQFLLSQSLKMGRGSATSA